MTFSVMDRHRVIFGRTVYESEESCIAGAFYSSDVVHCDIHCGPAFAATYYINEGSVDVKVSDAGVVTVEQGGVTYKDGLDSVVIRGGTRGGKDDDRTKADASPPHAGSRREQRPRSERDGSAQE